MSVGIESIASYIPEGRRNNLERLEKFDTDEKFLREKLGILEVAVAGEHEEAADLCESAFRALEKKTGALEENSIDALVVVTQTPGEKIPHVSAILHGRLGLSPRCACFDISLGCSGWVYGINVLRALMETNRYRKGLLFTADPYSKILNPEDRNTALLFGDAASVTLLSENAVLSIGHGTARTNGSESGRLATRNGILEMDGRAIFNFCAREIPADIREAVELNGTDLEEIDRIILHQGSKFIVDTITRRLGIPPEKVAFGIEHCGNTVSSSIPLLLEKELENTAARRIVVSGFGVGLSWASAVLTRISPSA